MDDLGIGLGFRLLLTHFSLIGEHHGDPSMPEILVLLMTWIPSDRPYVHPSMQDNVKWDTRLSPVLQPACFSAESCMANGFLEKQTEILKKAIHSCTRWICRQTWKEERREKENENAGDEQAKYNVRDSDWRMPAVKTENIAVSIGSVHLQSDWLRERPNFSIYDHGNAINTVTGIRGKSWSEIIKCK